MTAKSRESLFDVRCIERNIRKGLLKREDYKKYLKGLRDTGDKVTPVSVDESGPGDQAEGQ